MNMPWAQIWPLVVILLLILAIRKPLATFLAISRLRLRVPVLQLRPRSEFPPEVETVLGRLEEEALMLGFEFDSIRYQTPLIVGEESIWQLVLVHPDNYTRAFLSVEAGQNGQGTPTFELRSVLEDMTIVSSPRHSEFDPLPASPQLVRIALNDGNTFGEGYLEHLKRIELIGRAQRLALLNPQDDAFHYTTVQQARFEAAIDGRVLQAKRQGDARISPRLLTGLMWKKAPHFRRKAPAQNRRSSTGSHVKTDSTPPAGTEPLAKSSDEARAMGKARRMELHKSLLVSVTKVLVVAAMWILVLPFIPELPFGFILVGSVLAIVAHDLVTGFATRLFKTRSTEFFFLPFVLRAFRSKTLSLQQSREVLAALAAPLLGLVTGIVLVQKSFGTSEMSLALAWALLIVHLADWLPIRPMNGGQALGILLPSWARWVLRLAELGLAGGIIVYVSQTFRPEFLPVGLLLAASACLSLLSEWKNWRKKRVDIADPPSLTSPAVKLESDALEGASATRPLSDAEGFGGLSFVNDQKLEPCGASFCVFAALLYSLPVIGLIALALVTLSFQDDAFQDPWEVAFAAGLPPSASGVAFPPAQSEENAAPGFAELSAILSEDRQLRSALLTFLEGGHDADHSDQETGDPGIEESFDKEQSTDSLGGTEIVGEALGEDASRKTIDAWLLSTEATAIRRRIRQLAALRAFQTNEETTGQTLALPAALLLAEIDLLIERQSFDRALPLMILALNLQHQGVFDDQTSTHDVRLLLLEGFLQRLETLFASGVRLPQVELLARHLSLAHSWEAASLRVRTRQLLDGRLSEEPEPQTTVLKKVQRSLLVFFKIDPESSAPQSDQANHALDTHLAALALAANKTPPSNFQRTPAFVRAELAAAACSLLSLKERTGRYPTKAEQLPQQILAKGIRPQFDESNQLIALVLPNPAGAPDSEEVVWSLVSQTPSEP